MAILQLVWVTATALSPSFTVPEIDIRGVNGSNISMPILGLGTAFGWDSVGKNATTYDAVRLFLSLGGRAIHAARMYCNQEAIGRAIRDSGVPRKDLFVMTMVPQWHFGQEEAARSVGVSLKQLGLEYADLVMMHWPGTFNWQIPMYPPGDHRCGSGSLPRCHVELCGETVLQEPACKQGRWSWRQCRADTWDAFKRLQEAGTVRAIGVSNFETWMLDELSPPAAVNQILYRVGFHDDILKEHCDKQHTVVQTYSPLAGGRLAKPGDSPPQQLLKNIGNRHGVTSAQIALKYIVQNGGAAVPKAAVTDYMNEDFSLFDFSLSQDEMLSLSRLNTPSGEGAAGGGDPVAMMCQNRTSGRMARCLYLDSHLSAGAS